MQSLHHHGVFCWHAIAKRLGAIRSRNACRIEQVFSSPGNAVQWPTIVSGGNFRVGLFGLLQSQIARQCNDAVQLGVEPLQSVDIDIRQPLRSELAMLDPLR